jgi:hypothetical protein
MSNTSAKDGLLLAGFGVIICVLIIGITAKVFSDVRVTVQARTPAPQAAASISFTDTPTSTASELKPVATATAPLPTPPPPPVISTETKTYVEVTDGCAAHFQGECLLVRSGPSKQFPVVSKLRNGVVLRAVRATTTADGITWYKIIFDEWLRYPERLNGTWYIASNYVSVLEEPVEADFIPGVTPTTTKYIIVNRTKQRLYAYDGDTLFMTATTSTGLDNTPTPRGVFTIYKKTPSRYMQGPLPGLDSNQYYDLPGVPWNLYFTTGGAVIHGAYWHTAFGTPYSHGCVNLSLTDAKKIYDWAPVGTVVTVHD